MTALPTTYQSIIETTEGWAFVMEPAEVPEAPANPLHAMHCLEIWGGNHAVRSGVRVPGIDAWVTGETYHGESLGGDIHYVSTCGGGKIARFAVADVAGHGQAVAGIAVELRRLMRKHIDTVDQSRFARALNDEFSCRSSQGVFATAALATYYAPTRELIVCLAGHPAPWWYRSRFDRWEPLEPASEREPSPSATQTPGGARRLANLPLGIIAPTEYEQFSVTLDPDDLVLIYTDGVVEAESPEGNMLGPDGLRRMLEQSDPRHPSTLSTGLLERINRFRAAKPAEDDQTLILLHHTAAGPRPPKLRELPAVAARMLGILRV
ncbi:MAG: hypothetical protein FLDDKLPJ_00695 [Phycisphaerae bacterium]|nr:hypothetical protein [Phycisphaerae bacterium]